MSKYIKVYLLASFLSVVAPTAGAYGTPGANAVPPPMASESYGTGKPAKSESYGSTISRKLGNGASNLLVGWLEIPKNMMNTFNDVNFALGAIGGPVKGVLHSMGRTMAGVFDLLTFPVPTEPLTTPQHVWQNFTVETRYNPIRMKQ